MIELKWLNMKYKHKAYYKKREKNNFFLAVKNPFHRFAIPLEIERNYQKLILVIFKVNNQIKSFQ